MQNLGIWGLMGVGKNSFDQTPKTHTELFPRILNPYWRISIRGIDLLLLAIARTINARES